ncbi:hypothetical protein [Paenibacillus sp. HJGM_3]|uniref:hypothetical protein n=1 Tax=Paenibacillus sp. HJGM_3 TaxID=3379816 RepID=UPI00385A9A4E
MSVVADSAVSVYFAAGISMLSTTDMFREAMRHVESRYKSGGCSKVRVQTFFPYGTLDHLPTKSGQLRFIAGQAFTVGRDIYRQPKDTVGGRTLYREIRNDYDTENGGSIVLIGHSGGGIASYKAAQLLGEEGYPVMKVFMVGSPQIAICPSCRDKVFAIEHGGRFGDWISRSAFHWFRPAKVRARIPIRGGHRHYFCNQSKDENNVSNMDKVMDFIWGWIQGEPGIVYNGIKT